MSQGRFDPGSLDGLDEPVRRYLGHALAPGAPLDPAMRLAMRGRIRAGAWLPFRAEERIDGRSFRWHARVGLGPLTVLDVVDRYAPGGEAGMTGRLFGRVRLFAAEDEDTLRSVAGRTAAEAIWAPAALLPSRGVAWRAESDDLVVATWDLPPERPELRLRIDPGGAVRSAEVLRWGPTGRRSHGYLPCVAEVHAERRFGALTIPSKVTVGWGAGAAWRPFFEAQIEDAAPLAPDPR